MNEGKQKISMHQFFKKFPDSETARKQFEQWRWGDTVRCPHCDSVRISEANQKMPYRCKDCRKRFSVRTNTVMAHSNLDFQQWMLAVYIATVGIKGTASTKLAGDVGTSQTSAWYLGHRIRKALERDQFKMEGPVEVDETYIGGKRKNMSNSKRKDLKDAGRGAVGKTAIVGMKDRKTNRISASVVEKTDAETLQGFVADNADTDAKVYTDGATAYDGMPFDHESVNHSVSEYVREMAHTNGIESFWALLKRGYHGTHHHMSAKHLHRYVNEFAGRHAIRKIDTVDAMATIAKGMIGKQLRFEDLVK